MGRLRMERVVRGFPAYVSLRNTCWKDSSFLNSSFCEIFDQITVLSDSTTSSAGNTSPQSDDHEIELLLSNSWSTPLWKRLVEEVRDRISPEKLPPLQLTSRPVDVGMLEGDRLSLPWYRTVFTNLGDVISPETLPPLELESRPIDVGELIADQMAHPWWTSLLRNLADKVAPERLPPSEVTSKPMDPGGDSESMLLPRWSSVISTPKVFLPDRPKQDYVLTLPKPAATKPQPDAAEIQFIHAVEADLKRDLRRSIFRQRLWISFAVLEILALVGTSFLWK